MGQGFFSKIPAKFHHCSFSIFQSSFVESCSVTSRGVWYSKGRLDSFSSATPLLFFNIFSVLYSRVESSRVESCPVQGSPIFRIASNHSLFFSSGVSYSPVLLGQVGLSMVQGVSIYFGTPFFILLLYSPCLIMSNYVKKVDIFNI